MANLPFENKLSASDCYVTFIRESGLVVINPKKKFDQNGKIDLSVDATHLLSPTFVPLAGHTCVFTVSTPRAIQALKNYLLSRGFIINANFTQYCQLRFTDSWSQEEAVTAN